MKSKLVKIFVAVAVLAFITQYFFFTQSKKPLVIYIAENDHGDMSYASLMEGIIRGCHKKGLSIKTFSEFSSQTAKSQKQKARNSTLMSLENSRESVEKTAKFLDGEFIKMGDIEARSAMYKATWENLPKDITPTQLVERLETNVDNPTLLEMMKKDLATGYISGADKIGDLKNFYAFWRSPLHYKQIHEVMAQDVISNLTNATPDVIMIVAGSPHLVGLNKQLLLLEDSPKIVISNFPEGLDALNNYIYSGDKKVVTGIGSIVGFEVDLDKKQTVIPKEIEKMINEKFESK